MLSFYRRIIIKSLIILAIFAVYILVPSIRPDTPQAAETSSLDEPGWIGVEGYKGGVNLRWFRVQGAVQYVVQRRTGPKGEYSDISRVNNPTFDDFNTKAGEIYFYRIIPIDQLGNFGPSSIESVFQVPEAAPLKLGPPQWSLYNLKPDGIALTWSHPYYQHILAYNLYRKGPQDSTFTLITSSIGTSFLDQTVEFGKEYQYVLTAVDRKLMESEKTEELRILFTKKKTIFATDDHLASIETLEEVVSRSEQVIVFAWEKYGFISPVDVDYWDVNGWFFVADTGTGTITVLESNGEVAHQLGGMGEALWEFERLLGIAVSGNGYLYAADAYKGEIVVFTPRGTFQKRIRLIEQVKKYFGEDLLERFPWFRFGLVDLSMGPGGLLYVVDNPNGWIYVLNARDEIINVIGQKGPGKGQMHYPTFLAFDSFGHLYISDTMNSRVQFFDLQGTQSGVIGAYGLGIGQFIRPKGLAFDGQNRLYVADSYLNAIQVFSAQGDFLTLLGDEQGFPIDMGSPNGMIFIPPDQIVFSERLGRKIQIRKIYLDSPYLISREGGGRGKLTTPRPTPAPRPASSFAVSPYDNVLETLSYISGGGGSVTVELPVFAPGGNQILEEALPLIHGVIRILKAGHFEVYMRVYARDTSTGKASDYLARKRIATIRSLIGEDARLGLSVMDVAQDSVDKKDILEITLRNPR